MCCKEKCMQQYLYKSISPLKTISLLKVRIFHELNKSEERQSSVIRDENRNRNLTAQHLKGK